MRVIGKCEECMNAPLCKFKGVYKDSVNAFAAITPPENVAVDVRCRYYQLHQTVRA